MNFLSEQIVNLFIGRPRSSRRLRRFERKVFPKTKINHEKIIKWAEKKSNKYKINEKAYLESKDPIVKQGYSLRQNLLQEYKDKYKRSGLRIALHCPNKDVSIAHNSIFISLNNSLNYIGVDTALINWETNTKRFLEEFRPNVLISIDDQCYIEKLDWRTIKKYKDRYPLLIGLTASEKIHCNKDETVELKIEWGKKNSIDFYYSFWSKSYIKNCKEYLPYFESGYKIFIIEFGANILDYYPIPNIKKDLDFIFLCSSNRRKRPRYHLYFSEIFKNYYGFYDGPGFIIFNGNISFKRDKFVYSRAKVGLNLETENRIENANELNERTYTLAAMGIPQLTDNVKLLPKRFSKDALFTAKDEFEFYKMFKFILNNPKEAKRRALIAQREVYQKYTCLHRAESFVKDLLSL